MTKVEAIEYYNYLLKQVKRIEVTLTKLIEVNEENKSREIESLQRLKIIHSEKINRIKEAYPEI